MNSLIVPIESKILFFLIPLVITLVFESLMLLILREKRLKVYLVCLIMNIITNPLMNYLLGFVNPYYYWLWLGIMEVVVFIIEAIIYYLFIKDMRKAILYSLLCNLLSLTCGILILMLL